MLQLERALRSALALAALGALGAASAAAASPQLDLPDSRRRPAEEAPRKAPEGAKGAGDEGASKDGTTKPGETPVVDVKGRPVGSVTTRRVNAPGGEGEAGPGGLDLGGRQSGGSAQGRPSLDLPGRRRAPRRGATGGEAAPEGAGAPDAGPPATPAPRIDGVLPPADGAARVLLTRLTAIRRVGDDEVLQIADRLARLGEEGLEVARYALGRDEAPMVVAGARALLVGGTGEDADRVVRRLVGPIPRRAAAPVLRDLVELDPTRGTNAMLCSLLAHDSSQVRRAARGALRDRVTTEDLDHLTAVMAERSSEKRRIALELIADLPDGYATDHLLASLGDPSSKVAKVAIEGLARSDDPSVELVLERDLFASGVFGLRESRTALAIIEREDRLGRPILDDKAVPLLLGGLESPLPFVSGVAAIGLAGIGFRSDDLDGTGWLDGPVPGKLVAVVAGLEFFDGFDLVRDPAIRHLRQITGVTFANDGDAWAQWWARHSAGFSATRARIPLEPGDAERMVVTAHDPDLGAPIVLAGPELARDGSGFVPPEIGEVYFMLPADARDLASLMQSQGVFGGDRLPGTRGTFGLRGKTLDVVVGKHRKLFRVGEDFVQPWLRSILQRAYGLERRLDWQECVIPGELDDRRAVFLAELAAAEAEPGAAARAQRLETLVLRHLTAVEPRERDHGIVALLDLDDASDCLDLGDVWPIAALIESESGYTSRGRDLVELGLRAAGLDGADPEGAALAPEDAQRRADAAALLMDTLERAFGESGLGGIERILGALDEGAALEASRDARPLRRAAAAALLGDRPTSAIGEAEELTLIALAEDEDFTVRANAMRALGAHAVDRALPLLEARAASGPVGDRAVAVEMLGQVGGPRAMTLIVDALTAPDERLHLPAARGLAALGTPDTAPLLTSLMRTTSSEAVRGVARQGLVDLGPAARRELLIALRSTDERLRRTSALILAEMLEPRVVSELARMLIEFPGDERLLHELRVLTCVDYADEVSPGAAYLRFWEEAVQRDVLSWFLAGAARRGLRPPARAEFEGGGTQAARSFCIALQSGVDPAFSERARREFERMTGEVIGRVPEGGLDRRRWFQRAAELVDEAPEGLPAPVDPPAAAGDGR